MGCFLGSGRCCLVRSFTISNVTLHVTASIGAFANPGGILPEDRLDHADSAMYQAKPRGGGRHETDHRVTAAPDLEPVGVAEVLPGAQG